MAICINIYYRGRKNQAKRFAEEMLNRGLPEADQAFLRL